MAEVFDIMKIPEVVGGDELNDPHIFKRKFGNLSDDLWQKKLIASAAENQQDGVVFPLFPDQETQRKMHGATTVDIAVWESMEFYRFAKRHAGKPLTTPGFNLLDFGSGWGRIIRPYMKDIPFSNLMGYEPHTGYCIISRKLNPYVAFLNGDYYPDGCLPAKHFDMLVAWSIFSHLGQKCAVAWLAEFARVLKPGGRAIITSWGQKFLSRLQKQEEKLQNGEAIDWYSKVCIDAAGGSVAKIAHAYSEGEFVWFTSGRSTDYGEAFLPAEALQAWISDNDIPLKIEAVDTTSLAQVAFVLTAL